MNTHPQEHVTSAVETSVASRWVSIDIFRSLTMLSMLFVNDLGSLHDIPAWLGHAPAEVDGLGFADIVFPAFLFIVGLSIPLAIDRRLRAGDSKAGVLLHISKRAMALLVMGFFHVNAENINSDLTPIPRGLWSILMTLAFFLIWNAYPKGKDQKRVPVLLLQGIGAAMLCGLGWIYRGGSIEAPTGMQTHWWGILGLIGWAYLLCSILYLCQREHVARLGLIWLVLILLNAQEFHPLGSSPLRIVISASNFALVWIGVLTTTLALKPRIENRNKPALLIFLGGAAVFLLIGLLLRPVWGISKIRATPSWTLVCTGISLAVWTLVHFITEYGHKTDWARFLKPAARSTLTCYVLPYIVYPLVVSTGITLPSVLTGGLLGLCTSLAFALLIIALTGLLERGQIRLKI